MPQNVYYDTFKETKINMLFSVDLELWNLAGNAVLYYKYKEILKTIHL